VGFNLHAFFARLGFDNQQAGLQDGGDADGFEINRQFARLDLGDI
jgi:hypothetical protein